MENYLRLNRKINCWIWVVIPTCLLIQSAKGQGSPLRNVKSAFDTYQQQVYQEMIYVHSDKSFYVAGDIVWFKLYNVESETMVPSGLSKIAYVEILNKDLKPVLQGKIALSRGIGSGSFYLPFSLNSGNYLLRAYTAWMKNFSPSQFFEKEITIVNTTKKMGLMPKSDTTDYDIQFLPEGGNLVEDIQSKVACKVVDRSGHGVDFSGYI
ncbi:MAG TPA: hypothetical protein VKR32_05455, partial [Puia sp.]|nr:hypothetical protein [Puia sp.]